jgi:hypothetical protein
MGMETLNSAAHAAGFAMAASDEPYDDPKPEAKVEQNDWRPADAVLLTPATIERHWFRAMLGYFGRRASPA